jgi:hypothetical protein
MAEQLSFEFGGGRIREDDAPERYYLKIELMNDCTLTLSLPKTDSDPPYVYVSCENGEGLFDDWDVKSFREWVEVALGKRDHLRSLDCACCGRDERGPMLPDDVWNRLADPGERILCIDCMQKRAQQRLGRSLSLADLEPCPFNGDWFESGLVTKPAQ